jgi:hypothetical protein
MEFVTPLRYGLYDSEKKAMFIEEPWSLRLKASAPYILSNGTATFPPEADLPLA